VIRNRVTDEPAIVLHVRPYRETSLLVDLQTEHHGRVAGVARGVRHARRGHCLQPFYGVSVSWTGRSALVTLTSFESRRSAWFTGNVLASAYYAVELVMRLTREHEPHERLYEALEWLMRYLAEGHEMEIGLRQFESVLLEEIGYAIEFDVEAGGGSAIKPNGEYRFEFGVGFVAVSGRSGPDVIMGEALLAIANRQWQRSDARRVARRIFRRSLETLLGPRPLQSRRLLRRGA
jgi:DNA repair protein RecO (recombination protein O)|tara:strand:+ start:923 stop:1624 length:702 start_codon:yes stop_codon:yes gene_type:complete